MHFRLMLVRPPFLYPTFILSSTWICSVSEECLLVFWHCPLHMCGCAYFQVAIAGVEDMAVGIESHIVMSDDM